MDDNGQVASTAPPAAGPDIATLESVVELAGRAPSIHNTQPWRWQLRRDALVLRADRERQLAVADPDGHSLLLSCGAALAVAEWGLRAAGQGVTVERHPDPNDPDELAVLRFTGGAEPDPIAEALAEAAQRRRSDRRPFRADGVTPDALERLRAATDGDGVHVDFPMSDDHRIELAVAVSWADRIEQNDKAYVDEMRQWLRDPDVHDQTPDGIPTDAVPHVTVAHPRRSDVPLRNFELGVPGRQLIAQDVDERPLLAVLFTESDSPADQLRAGEAMMRLWLAAQQEGLESCPLSQAVDLAAFRYKLQGLLGWVGLPQMVMRIGRPVGGGEPHRLTPRRPVADVLEVTAN